MKRKGFVIISVLLGVLLFGSCKSINLGVYDKSVPKDQLCTLQIVGAVRVNTFDGKTAGWSNWHYQNFWGTPGWSSDNVTTIQIPAGPHSLDVVFSAFWEENGRRITVTSEKYIISHEFAAGRTYRLKARVRLLPSGHITEVYENDTWDPFKYIALRPDLFNVHSIYLEEVES